MGSFHIKKPRMQTQFRACKTVLCEEPRSSRNRPGKHISWLGIRNKKSGIMDLDVSTSAPGKKRKKMGGPLKLSKNSLKTPEGAARRYDPKASEASQLDLQTKMLKMLLIKFCCIKNGGP